MPHHPEQRRKARPAMESTPRPDDTLVANLREGNAQVLAELYARYANEVYSIGLRYLRSVPDAEDLLQDVFVGLPEAAQRYQPCGRFGAWLRRVAIRTALMRIRAQRIRREESIESAAQAALDAPAATDVITARDAIDGLPVELRTVFLLKEVDGHSHAEIALLLDISPGASAVRLFRAWKTLLERVGRTS
jgi:RNA polymerase sigma-70 factor, ECF subfamily